MGTPVLPEQQVRTGMWAMALYIHNTNGLQFFEDVYGPVASYAPQYVNEKAELFASRPTRAIGQLDAPHSRKLLAAVDARYTQVATNLLRSVESPLDRLQRSKDPSPA